MIWAPHSAVVRSKAASMSGSDISGYSSGACPTSRSVRVNTTSPKRRSTCSRVRERNFGTRPGLMSGSWPGRSEKSRTVLDAKHGAGLDGPKIACSNSLSGVRVSHARRKKDTPYEGLEWPSRTGYEQSSHTVGDNHDRTIDSEEVSTQQCRTLGQGSGVIVNERGSNWSESDQSGLPPGPAA